MVLLIALTLLAATVQATPDQHDGFTFVSLVSTITVATRPFVEMRACPEAG
jgi:hypothetical protein